MTFKLKTATLRALATGAVWATLLTAAPQAWAQTAADPEAVLNEALDIEPMVCEGDAISFDCVTTYLGDIQEKVDPFIKANLETIKTELDNAENADAEFDKLIELADALRDTAMEGGPLTTEIDRIGKLIQEKLDEVKADPDLADLVPLFEAEFVKWQAVRDRLNDVRVGADEVSRVLDAGKRRAAALLSLKYIRQAIAAAEETVGGMENVLDALNELSLQTAAPAQADGAAD